MSQNMTVKIARWHDAHPQLKNKLNNNPWLIVEWDVSPDTVHHFNGERLQVGVAYEGDWLKKTINDAIYCWEDVSEPCPGIFQPTGQPGTTECDECGCLSNSEPGLPCGWTGDEDDSDYDEDTGGDR